MSIITDMIKAVYCLLFQRGKYVLIAKTHNQGRPGRFFDQAAFPARQRFKGLFDYARFRTLELLAEEVERNQVSGALAELGVYQGGFAAAINALFPERYLYLFDTFSGFDPGQLGLEREKGLSVAFDGQSFANASAEKVLALTPHREMCLVRKGLFPETAQGVTDTFALVSLDVDIYQPTYDGLCWFYPRLAPGGYIMIHDYNDPDCPGVRQALADYQAEYGPLCAVPISDRFGTLVITKPRPGSAQERRDNDGRL